MATSVAVALLVTTPAQAGTTYQLDGRKKRTVNYNGVLSESSLLRMDSVTREEPLTASRTGCTDASCDLRAVSLGVAPGGTAGRLKVSVTFARELEAALLLYDAKGKLLASDDVLNPVPPKQDCCEGLTYRLEVTQERLPRGRYTIAIVDRVGTGTFQATVDWFAHPPDRRSS